MQASLITRYVSAASSSGMPNSSRCRFVVKKGELAIEQGDVGDYFYIVEEGDIYEFRIKKKA